MMLLYLQMNVVLAVSSLLRPPSLRWAQALLLLSLSLPVGFHFLPQRSIPLPDRVLVPLAEVGEAFRPVRKPFDRVKETPVAVADAPPSPPLDVRWIVSVVWTLGTFSYALWLAMQAFRLGSLLRRATPVRRLGRVRIVLSSEITIPFSTRIFGVAWVALPESLLAHGNDFKIAIAHELQHHRQGDTRWAWAMEILTLFFAFNPFMHKWKRKIHEMQELSCDEALIGHKLSKYEYGSCLVRVAETALETRPMFVGTANMATSFGNPTYFKSFLRRRIEMLSNRQKRPVLTGLVGIVGLLTTACAAYGARMVQSEAVITVEPEVQKIAEAALGAALKRHKASLGFVVVSDPKTGRILAVANQDIVNPNAERSPHWSLSLRVGPASISKAIVAAAAVQKGVTTVDEVHSCENGKYKLGGHLFRDWKSFDKLTTRQTVAHSSNICGIKVGEKLGALGVQQAFKDFGFGPGGSADGFPESRPGELAPSNGDDTYYTATVATGFNGMFVSPVEVVQAFGIIANGGNLLKPQYGEGVKAQVVRRVLSEDSAKKMRDVLKDTLIYGTAKDSASKIYTIAGKTATGYSRSNANHDKSDWESNMASFVGFAPADEPRLVIYVAVENPTDIKGVHGSYHAAPVFKEVAEKTLEYLKVPRG